VKHSGLWYLGGGYGGIADKVQPLIAPVTQMAQMYSPPIPPETLEQYIWRLSKETQCISLNAEALLQKTLLQEGRTMVGTEHWVDYPPGSGKKYAYMGGEDPTPEHKPRLVALAEVPEPGGQWTASTFDDPGGTVTPPPNVLELTHWPTDYKVITQDFGVNPDDYNHYCDNNNLCLPGHNGKDIRAPLGSPFRAAVAGTVIWVSDQRPSGGPSDYGWHIRVKTGDYTIIYAHAAPNPPVSVGDYVTGNQILGFSGNTGNSEGAHLHFEMRHCDLSAPEWPWCIIDPTEYLEPLMEEPPNPNNIDMLRYFRVVPEGYGPFCVLQHNSGITEDIQTMVSAGGVYFVKNALYEHLRVTAGHVERKEDTSPGNNKFYTLDDGYGWSKWCPRYWRPGDSFRRSPTVRFYDLDLCNMESENADVVSYLRFDAHHQSWTSPPSNASPSGITLPNVAEMSFMFVEGGDILERYWFAHSVGLVQWMNNQGAHSWISELPHGRDPLVPDITDCV
jgi:murein DD-endopeptidase MepM/ murein hydrolase activator NlpD